DGLLVYGTNLDYAATHQYGATIHPTNAKALAIPLTKEAARAGSPRDWSDASLFLYRPKKGDKAFLAESKQKGGKRRGFTQLVLHYVLVQSVKIPARPFLGWRAKLIETCT